jgi:hypothetical protein
MTAESPPVLRDVVDPPQHLVTDIEIVARKREAGHLDALRRRNERLRDEQVRQGRQRQSLRRRKQQTSAVVERIVGERGKARVPHQVREERSVDDHRRAPLIAGTGPIRPDEAVVLNADGDRLGIAEDGSLKGNGRELTFADGRRLFVGSSGTGAPNDGKEPQAGRRQRARGSAAYGSSVADTRNRALGSI